MNNSIEQLDEKAFITLLANKGGNLVNENDLPLTELIHPLTFTIDPKRHQDMISVPVGYKFHRKFHALFKELRDL